MKCVVDKRSELDYNYKGGRSEHYPAGKWVQQEHDRPESKKIQIKSAARSTALPEEAWPRYHQKNTGRTSTNTNNSACIVSTTTTGRRGRLSIGTRGPTRQLLLEGAQNLAARPVYKNIPKAAITTKKRRRTYKGPEG